MPRSLPPSAAELLSPATQIVRRGDDDLGDGHGDVGQRIADDKLELFVGVEPAQALLQAFAQWQPEFIALHDIGGMQSLRLLNAVAAALHTKVQQLAIRRQGHGVALATLLFVEIPGGGPRPLRVYCTDIDADSQTRRAVSQVLLGHARLSVLMVGEMPPHLLSGALQPLRDAMTKGPWPNRELLLVPHGAPGALAAQATALSLHPGQQVRVTPQALSPNDAWGYVTGAWNRLRGAQPSSAAVPAAAAAYAEDAATEPMPLQQPAAATASPAAFPTPEPAAADPLWARYLQACLGLKGLVSACVFDVREGRGARALAHVGGRPDAERLAAQGLALFTAMAEGGRALGLGPSQPDAAITLTGHHLLLHPLPGHHGFVLHAVLDASVANLTLARMQLQRVDGSVLGAQ